MCVPGDLSCAAGDLAKSAITSGLKEFANSVLTAVGDGVSSVSTAWVHVATPRITGSGDSASAGAVPPEAANMIAIIGWAKWVALAVCVSAIIALGARLALARSSDGAWSVLGRLNIALAAVLLISGSGSLLAFFVPTGQSSSNATAAVAFLQNSTAYYVALFAVLSLIVGALRMVWSSRGAEAARDVLQAMLTLVVVSTSAVVAIGLLTVAADSFSNWIIKRSAGKGFGETLTELVVLTSTNPVSSTMTSFVVILVGAFIFLTLLVQVVLLVVRGAMLIIIAGLFPAAASVSSTATGRQWFQRFVAWTIAFIVYKPAAAIVYAAAFRLLGGGLFSTDPSHLLDIITGATLCLLAVLAMPALMRCIVPASAALASGAGMSTQLAVGAVAGGAAIVPLAGMAMGGGSSDSSSSSGGGAGSTAMPDGAAGSSGAAGGGAGPAGGAGGAGPAGSSGASGSSGAAGSAGAAGSGAAAGGTSAGAAAAAGPAAPVVMGAQMVQQRVAGAAQDAQQGAAEGATGDTPN